MALAKYPPRQLDGGGNIPHTNAMANLLDEILSLCRDHDLSESQFGVLALNDKNLIPQLRGDGGTRPRRLWPETEAKVREFIATYQPPASAAA